MPTQRYIAHFDLDSFFVSVERLKDPALLGKPVIVGGHSGRAVVAACSYETRKFGVHSAMPMHQALRLCPQAIVVKGNMPDYSHYSRVVTNIILNKMPLVEKASIDEFYVDLTGMDKYFGCYDQTAQLKAEILRNTGLPVSFALASNKLISKIATNEAKPNGEIEILPGTEKMFLAPLKIGKMPMIGENTASLLLRSGIQTIGQLAAASLPVIQKLLGKNGIDLWYKANAIDNGPVNPFQEQKSISSENTFETDITDPGFLLQEIARLLEKICYELRRENKVSGCVAIKLRYENFDTLSRQTVMPYTAADHRIVPLAKSLFEQVYDPRRQVRLIGVRLSELVAAGSQVSLFEQAEAIPGLYRAIDEVKEKFGVQSLQRAVSIQAMKNKSVRPDDPLWLNRNADKLDGNTDT